jgi:hypothetical protein
VTASDVISFDGLPPIVTILPYADQKYTVLNKRAMNMSADNTRTEVDDFLKRHGLTRNEVFDAKGKSVSTWYSLMKKLDKHIAINTTPCERSGHTIRDRSGHCLVCNPAHIAFQVRSSKAGFIYIARSFKLRSCKIGFAENLDSRIESLNRTKYAGADDWRMAIAFQSPQAGRIEIEIKSALSEFSSEVTAFTDKNGKDAVSMELYQDRYSEIKPALIKYLKKNDFSFKIIDPEY